MSQCNREHGMGCLTQVLLVLIGLGIHAHYPGAGLLLILLAFCG